VLVIAIPAKIFEAVLSSAEVGVSSFSSQPGPEEIALTNHIDQFLDILTIFQSAQEPAVRTMISGCEVPSMMMI
jgi:hypothetical protein